MRIFPLLISIVLPFLWTQSLSAQNCGCADEGNCPYPFPANNSSQVCYEITDAFNNNLASPSQGVCGVYVKFRHGRVGGLDLVVRPPWRFLRSYVLKRFLHQLQHLDPHRPLGHPLRALQHPLPPRHPQQLQLPLPVQWLPRQLPLGQCQLLRIVPPLQWLPGRLRLRPSQRPMVPRHQQQRPVQWRRNTRLQNHPLRPVRHPLLRSRCRQPQLRTRCQRLHRRQHAEPHPHPTLWRTPARPR